MRSKWKMSKHVNMEKESMEQRSKFRLFFQQKGNHQQRALGGIIAGGILLVVLSLLLWHPWTATSTPVDLAEHVQTIADIPLSGGSSRMDYQSLDPKSHLLFVSHLGASMVSVFNTTSNTVVADIPGIPAVHGVLAIPELGRVYASATGANQVDVIDERTLRVTAKIPGGIYPDGVAYDPIRHRLFVSDETGQTDTVIDTQTEQWIATIPLGGEVGNTQYDPVSGRILVDVQTLNQLVVIDPTTTQVVARHALPGCQHDHSLLLDAARRLAFVVCDENNVLLVVDLRTFRVRSVQSVGNAPDVLAFDQQRHLLYVASESGVISLFEEQGQNVRKVGDQFIAPEAHTVAVDQQTHRVYLPLENLGGKPVLRIAQFSVPGNAS